MARPAHEANNLSSANITLFKLRAPFLVGALLGGRVHTASLDSYLDGGEFRKFEYARTG